MFGFSRNSIERNSILRELNAIFAFDAYIEPMLHTFKRTLAINGRHAIYCFLNYSKL